MSVAPMCVVQNIQGKSKRNPNWAKLSQIQQSPAKDNQGKSLDLLVRIKPYQGLARTPQGVFSFACPVRPHGLARIEPPLRRGALLFSMSASFNCARSAALSFLECIMAQIPKICKENVEKSPKRPEFRAFGDAVARPRLRRPTAAPAGRDTTVKTGLHRFPSPIGLALAHRAFARVLFRRIHSPCSSSSYVMRSSLALAKRRLFAPALQTAPRCCGPARLSSLEHDCILCFFAIAARRKNARKTEKGAEALASPCRTAAAFKFKRCGAPHLGVGK